MHSVPNVTQNLFSLFFQTANANDQTNTRDDAGLPIVYGSCKLLDMLGYGSVISSTNTGIEYEKKADYESLRDAYSLRSQYPNISDCMFALPQNGQEIDVLQTVSSETVQYLEQLRYRSSTFCRNMIKHKKLNDINNIFNRMV
jgi:hypothetical protein